ncbi:adenylyltransferase [Acidithiobacillus thiooxidans]|nr:adenylyltransferase [Acidithiobacillus thiooxidans]
MLLTGAFAPLTGFLDQADWQSVVENMRLRDDTLWPIPVVLDVDDALGSTLRAGDRLRLERSDGTPLAALTVSECYQPDKKLEAEAVYGSTDRNHPGVAELFDRGSWYVGGTVTPWDAQTLSRAAAVEFPPEYQTPAQLRAQWTGQHPVVAFQTRNPLHHAHIAVTQAGLEQAGTGAKLLLHPAIGPTKPGDIEAAYRMRVYRAVLDHYPQGQALLSPLPLAMRMAGPREALWHALIRRNFGATHFIIGRGHADPGASAGGLFYPTFAAQELFAQHAQEMGISGIFLPEFAYSPTRRQYVPVSEANGEALAGISGTELRRKLANREEIPEWFSPTEVIRILRQAYRGADRRGLVIWFTGLSASGKSTLAGMLVRQLEAEDERAVTMLDGDIIRRFLSKGLSFSRDDRDENIRRIGFVASLVARHGGIAVVAAISPYRQARAEARRLVEEAGGLFLEVHVATPLALCAERDPKGLYAKALRGEIKGFTGVDDPYEEPEHPDCVVNHAQQEPAAALAALMDLLHRSGAVSDHVAGR